MSLSNIYSKKLINRIFASGAIGNILETYDLILISLLATQITHAFFPPSSTPYANIINILYIFLVGLLFRAFGNIVMGTFADQIGRKKLMVISLIFTGIGTLLIGILPTYSSIGILSTILFIGLRIIQNFFTGIEYINSATYLIESSDPKNKGYYASWTAIGISGGYLLASIVSLIVTTLIDNKLIPEWSWRFVFLFSIFGIIFGLYLRKSIPESLSFIMHNRPNQVAKKSGLLKESIKYIIGNPTQCLSIGAITLTAACLTYIYYIYIPINLMTYRHFTKIEVYGLNSICLLAVVLLIPFFGKISDYINRITLLKINCWIVLILALPFFWLCSNGTRTEIFLITLLISIPASCFFSLYPALITESFPTKIRCTTASVIYQIVVCIEMGTLPLIIVKLIDLTKLEYSPAFLLIASALISYVGLIYLKRQTT